MSSICYQKRKQSGWHFVSSLIVGQCDLNWWEATLVPRNFCKGSIQPTARIVSLYFFCWKEIARFLSIQSGAHTRSWPGGEKKKGKTRSKSAENPTLQSVRLEERRLTILSLPKMSHPLTLFVTSSRSPDTLGKIQGGVVCPVYIFGFMPRVEKASHLSGNVHQIKPYHISLTLSKLWEKLLVIAQIKV